MAGLPNLLLVWSLIAFGAHCEKSTGKTRVVQPKSREQPQSELLSSQDHVINELQRTLHEWNEERIQQREVIEKQAQAIDTLQETAAIQAKRLESLERAALINAPTPDKKIEEFSTTGCLAQDLPLFCPDGRTISVTRAIYGQYSEDCQLCCNPGGADCSESVAENNPSDWLSVLAQCENSTSCVYQYSGAVIDECEVDYLADYMQIFFNCLPDTSAETEPVGFTAFTEEIRIYASGAIIQYPDIISNFGNHYDNSTGKFHCPYYGTYMFTTHFNAYWEEEVDLEIMRNDTVLVRAWAGAVSSLYNQASAFVITECAPGDEVYARAIVYSVMTGSPLSHFAGYLLQRLD